MLSELRMLAEKIGIESAWALARRIVLMGTYELDDAFGITDIVTVFTTLSFEEAEDKMNQYDKEERKIVVGDEVIWPERPEIGSMIVTRVISKAEGGPYYYGFCTRDGRPVQGAARYRKTGRHLKEIAEILAGEEVNDKEGDSEA